MLCRQGRRSYFPRPFLSEPKDDLGSRKLDLEVWPQLYTGPTVQHSSVEGQYLEAFD